MMRRWAIVTAVVLTGALLMAGFALLPPRRHGHLSTSRMAQLGLVLLDDASGLYVLGVIDGSLAGSAGIEPGDYLTSTGDMPLTAASQLEDLLAGRNEAVALPLTLNRHDQIFTVNLPLQ